MKDSLRLERKGVCGMKEGLRLEPGGDFPLEEGRLREPEEAFGWSAVAEAVKNAEKTGRLQASENENSISGLLNHGT